MADDTVRLGPVRLPDGVLSMRTPRTGDAAAWSAARLANRQWLERAFPAWGDDWAAEQSEAAWVRRCLSLRQAAQAGLAKPFVLLLDGRLIGELGIDAVDELSGGGEASVWMVREHGGDVMNAASLIFMDYCLSGPDPVDRLVSPVATTSRQGRSPGLRAVGFDIEGQLPRKVGDKGMVEHDIWTVQNTPEVRARIATMSASLPTADEVPEQAVRGARTATAAATVRALARTARSAAAARRGDGPGLPELRGVLDGVTLRADERGYEVLRADTVLGRLDVKDDVGTGVVEIVPAPNADAGRDTDGLTDALAVLLAAVTDGRFAAHLPAVRVPLDASGLPGPDVLEGLGLHLAATFAGNPEGRRHWGGEQWWQP